MLIDQSSCDMWIIRGLKGLAQLIDQRTKSREKVNQCIIYELERLKQAMEMLLIKDEESEEEVDVVLLIGLAAMIQALMNRVMNVESKIHKDCKSELMDYLNSISASLNRVKAA